MLSQSQLRSLSGRLGKDRLRRNVVLAPFTTFRIGGPADLFYSANSAEELRDAIVAARDLDAPHFLLGLGANILVGDAGFRGLVVHNNARAVDVHPEEETLTAESGAIVYPDVIDIAIAAGLAGFEHYAGIPSTIGGALWQNLHFLSPAPERDRTVYIEEILASAEMLLGDNRVHVVEPAYFAFGYDESRLQHCDDVALKATFQLKAASPDILREVAKANLSWRAERHPPLDSRPSAGSIFKKIEGIGAGRLIDRCEMKGTRIGGAEISEQHANFIVNRGDARASDVLALIALVQQKVEKETGYRLQTEINLIGER